MEVSFLQSPSAKRLRKEISNICDSYSHPWDLLAELSQNAVDAVRTHRRMYGEAAKQHSITVEINAQTRSILLRDTGIGFDPKAVVEFLAPHGSGKDPMDTRVIGQKGVGLTYVIFMADRFSLKTKSVNGTFSGSIVNASMWKRGKTDIEPSLAIAVNSEDAGAPAETYTEVLIEGVDDDYVSPYDDIFNQTVPVLEYLLRTRTAIGSTRPIFRPTEKEELDVFLKVTDKVGKQTTKKIPFAYLLPESLMAAGQSVDLEEFKKIAAPLDDRQKAKRLQGKCLRKVGSEQRVGREINYYAFFVPSRHTWSSMNEKNQLQAVADEQGNVEGLVNGGLFVATRGMPTGIELNPPRTGTTGTGQTYSSSSKTTR